MRVFAPCCPQLHTARIQPLCRCCQVQPPPCRRPDNVPVFALCLPANPLTTARVAFAGEPADEEVEDVL